MPDNIIIKFKDINPLVAYYDVAVYRNFIQPIKLDTSNNNNILKNMKAKIK